MPRHRNTHTTVAIKLPAYPTINLPPPSQSPRRHSKPTGYTGAPTCQTSQTGQTSQTLAPRHRNTHTPVAIKKAPHTPAAHLRPSHTRLRQANPRGIQGRTNLSDRSDKSDRSDTSATPTQHAYRRCHQASKAYPCGKSARCITLRHICPPAPHHTAAPGTHLRHPPSHPYLSVKKQRLLQT